MASFPISPPEGFNFIQGEWQKWIRRFERYRQGSGLKSKSEEHQVNALIYVMGDKADDILCSFGLTEDEKKVYNTVKEKFDSYFEPQRNVIFERAKFNQRRQQQGESVDAFITDLYCLADRCNYGELRNEMIRDRIVVGLLDDALSEKLQLDSRLTLETAVVTARQSEEVHKQQVVVRQKPTDLNNDLVDAVRASKGADKKKFANKGGDKNASDPSRRQSSAQQRQQHCTRCGKTPNHSRQQCPAKEAICHRCGKKGHYQSMCRTFLKQVQAVTSEASNDQFLGVVTSSKSHNLWNVTVMVNGNAVEFKLDTGADVNVIPEDTFKTLKINALHSTDTNLTGAGSQPLQVCGKFEANLQYKARSSRQTVYVVSTLSKALLGKPAIESLNLITRVDSVDKDSCKAKYPELFTGLGSLEGEYKIKLKANSAPFALTTPRRIAHPLMPRVKEELERMEKIGVITKISEPTEWCAGIVVVPKPNGKIRICVDLTKLNESVCRERHVLPAVDRVLAQLSGATVFSKLDTNSGFWQIRLAEESRKLTTFITPMGRYCFNRLPFGITSAPEHFQRKMSQILEGQEGAVCMMDDILIYGSTQDEHDSRLISVLDKIKASGATLNEDKCQFSKKSIKFLGHIIDSSGIHPDPDKVQAIVEMKAPANVTEVRRFLGMVHQMSKFAPHLAD